MRDSLKNALIETADDVANKDGYALVNILKQGGVAEVALAGGVVSMLSGMSIAILRIAEMVGEDPLDLVDAVRFGIEKVDSLDGFYANEEEGGNTYGS